MHFTDSLGYRLKLGSQLGGASGFVGRIAWAVPFFGHILGVRIALIDANQQHPIPAKRRARGCGLAPTRIQFEVVFHQGPYFVGPNAVTPWKWPPARSPETPSKDTMQPFSERETVRATTADCFENHLQCELRRLTYC